MNMKPETDDCNLEAAKGHLMQAERKLQHARTEEGQAEQEIEKAVEKIERIEHEPRESEVIVNGRQREVPGNIVSYEELVKIAFPHGPTKQNTRFTITYKNAAQVPPTGELDMGQKVKVKAGSKCGGETIFNVSETVLS